MNELLIEVAKLLVALQSGAKKEEIEESVLNLLTRVAELRAKDPK